jgi:hypothetical protein
MAMGHFTNEIGKVSLLPGAPLPLLLGCSNKNPERNSHVV